MAYDRTINTETGDYDDAVGGEYAETLTIATGIYHQVRGERNRWWGDPNAGSDLYLVKQLGTGPVGQRAAENAIRTALQPFVDQGLAADLEVKAEGLGSGRIVMTSEITDVQHGLVVDSAPLGEA